MCPTTEICVRQFVPENGRVEVEMPRRIHTGSNAWRNVERVRVD